MTSAASTAVATTKALDGEIVAPLTKAEERQLGAHEKAIETGIKSFADMGAALGAIRDARLYRASHTTFDVYLAERWQVSKSYANQLISAAATAAVVPIQNEAQARALSGLQPEEAKEVFSTAQEMAKRPPTAMDLKFARERVEAPKKKERAKQQAAKRKAAAAKPSRKPSAKKLREEAERRCTASVRFMSAGSGLAALFTDQREHLSEEVVQQLLADLDTAQERLLVHIAEAKSALTGEV